jgi:preprotein translocase, YajC subunit
MNILAAAEPAGGMNMMFIIAIYAVVLGGGYFLLMRPQKKEQKRVQAMISELETGDTVLTTSGFYGVVIDVTEEDVVVEFGSNKNCRIPMRKEAIAQVEKPE